MVLSKKEYEQMQQYKEVGIKFEKLYNQKVEQIKDLKTYLKVAIRLAEMSDILDKNKIIVYKELLQYIEKFC